MDVLRTDDFLRTKISWKHRLPYFLTHGALMDVGQGQFFSATFAGPWFVEMQKFCYKGPGLISFSDLFCGAHN